MIAEPIQRRSTGLLLLPRADPAPANITRGQKEEGDPEVRTLECERDAFENVFHYVSYVQTYDTKPKRRLFELLKSQGFQANQQVTFLSDGADDVRELRLYLSPESDIGWIGFMSRCGFG
jgi:hypothetical protein